MKILECKHCKNKIAFISDSGVTPICCGEKMTTIVPNTVDASKEKHVPVVEINGRELKVKVGSVDHPMLPEHHIEFVIAVTNKGVLRQNLVSGLPIAQFTLQKDEIVKEVYEFCNLHGLWKTVL